MQSQSDKLEQLMIDLIPATNGMSITFLQEVESIIRSDRAILVQKLNGHYVQYLAAEGEAKHTQLLIVQRLLAIAEEEGIELVLHRSTRRYRLKKDKNTERRQLRTSVKQEFLDAVNEKKQVVRGARIRHIRDMQLTLDTLVKEIADDNDEAIALLYQQLKQDMEQIGTGMQQMSALRLLFESI